MKEVRTRAGKACLLRDERGLSTVEYVIILVLIAAACVGLWVNLGTTIKGKIGGATEEIEKEVQIKDDDTQ